MTARRMYFFCYHKTGTVLCTAIARKIAARFGWSATILPGLVKSVDPAKQIVVFAHSLIDFDLQSTPHRGVRPDPRPP